METSCGGSPKTSNSNSEKCHTSKFEVSKWVQPEGFLPKHVFAFLYSHMWVLWMGLFWKGPLFGLVQAGRPSRFESLFLHDHVTASHPPHPLQKPTDGLRSAWRTLAALAPANPMSNPNYSQLRFFFLHARKSESSLVYMSLFFSTPRMASQTNLQKAILVYMSSALWVRVRTCLLRMG